MSILGNRQLLAPTLMQCSEYMYSNADKINYWRDWAKNFISCCVNYMGWEVAPGPGSSLGTIMMPPIMYPSNHQGDKEQTYTLGKYAIGITGWDCDWTTESNVSNYISDPEFLFYYYDYSNTISKIQRYSPNSSRIMLRTDKWFNDIWTSSNLIDDRTGRFDFIVYVNENENGQKIGFRVKYPACSLAYNAYNTNPSISYGIRSSYSNSYWSLVSKLWYRAPVITLYNNELQDANSYFYVSPEKQVALGPQLIEESLNKDNSPLRGNIYILGSNFTWYNIIQPVVKDSGFVAANKLSFAAQGGEIIGGETSWNLSMDNIKASTSSNAWNIPDAPYGHGFDYYKNYNIFNYQMSKSKETQYMYVTNINNNVNENCLLKVLTTTLTNGEKVVLVDAVSPNDITDKTKYNMGALCEFYMTTTGVSDVSDRGQTVVKIPNHPYNSYNNNTGSDYVLQKALLPGQKVFCNELYYVIKYPDEKDLQKDYIYAQDEKGAWRYFRIIDFGYNSKLAFPIVGPADIN